MRQQSVIRQPNKGDFCIASGGGYRQVMGRAQGHAANTSPAVAGARHRARRRFNVAVALRTFNAAAAERARLAQLTSELAAQATVHAWEARSEQLTAFAQAAHLPVSLSDEADRVRDAAQFGLHSELRVALDEGRRLREHDVERLAQAAVDNAVCAMLADAAHEQDPSLSVPAWHELLRGALRDGQPSSVPSRAAVGQLLRELS